MLFFSKFELTINQIHSFQNYGTHNNIFHVKIENPFFCVENYSENQNNMKKKKRNTDLITFVNDVKSQTYKKGFEKYTSIHSCNSST